MSNTFWFCFTFLIAKKILPCKMSTMNCCSHVNCVILAQREEKEDYAAEAQFVDEHGRVLARKVSQLCFHYLH